MKLKIDKSFDKDCQKIKNKKLKQKLRETLENIQAADQPSDIKNIKKLQGTKEFYSIRLGDYRIGAILIKKEIQLIRFLNRKDIYKYFP